MKTYTKATKKSFKTGASLLMAGAILFTYGYATTSAQDISMSIPVNTVVRNAKAPHKLAKAEVPTDLVGRICSVKVEGENNSSVHPGNDLKIESDGNYVELKDVEREKGAITEADEELELGEKVTVTLSKVGKSKVFSAGFDVEIHCPAPAVEAEPVEEKEPESGKGGDSEKEPETKAAISEPEALPATGPAAILGTFVGTSVIGGIAHSIVARRYNK